MVKDNTIFDIKPSDNNSIEHFTGSIDKYIGSKSKEDNYKPYVVKNKIVKRFNAISISENSRETNYFQNHKMLYDLNIDFTGKVTANIYYPDEIKGGYAFNLSKDDFNIFKGIVNNFSIDKVGKEYFIDDNYCSQAIVINHKIILNDYNKMRLDLDIQAIIMFSNVITMKYITQEKATNNVYKIESSRYTKMFKPEQLK